MRVSRGKKKRDEEEEEAYQRELASAARAGRCSLDPDVGRWVRMGLGIEVRSETAEDVLSLAELVKHVLPSRADLLQKQHQAGIDAELHLLIHAELCKIAQTAKSGRPGELPNEPSDRLTKG